MSQYRDELIHALREAGKYLSAHELTWGKAGNVSARLDEDHLLVTASGTNLGALGLEDFVEVSVGEMAGQIYARRPTKELPMHRAVYALRPEINAVVHAAPFYTTLIACSKAEVPAGLFVESMYYLERVARVPYAHPGSARLGDLVAEKARDANLLLLDNHGVLAYDSSIEEALMGVQAFELAAKMLITSRSAGVDLRILTPETVQDFLSNAGYRPLRRWPK